MRRWIWVTLVIAAVLLGSVGITWLIWRIDEVRGIVTEEGRPVTGAVVRVKTTTYKAVTNESGAFTLVGFPHAFRVHVTAWKDGYYIGGTVAWPWKRTVTIALQRYHTADNPDYAWIPPVIENRSGFKNFFIQTGLSAAARISFNRAFLPLAARLELGCADCHGQIFEEWAGSAHAQGVNNIRFLTMYNGTDTQGNKSPETRYGFHRDYGRFPLRPDLNAPYYGPGFKLDFPDQAGNCAACHAPTAALSYPYGTDINLVEGINRLGSHCDFCHKVVDVRVNPVTQLPYENMPGILSMELRRPQGEPQLFFGPFDDVDVGPDTFLPLQNESRYCAACHNANFWGTPIYQSYAEWLASPYPQEGKTCQACHMKPNGVTTNFAPGRGGLERDPEKIFTHAFPGAADVALLQDTAKLELSAQQEGNRILVEVRVTNENGGHHIPTDHPMRNILLLVTATDAQRNELQYLGDQVIPEWGGVGDEPNDYAGRPGKGYAKILEELWTEVSPTAAYWSQTRIQSDTRIPAKETDTSVYEFLVPKGGGEVRIEARLIFRRAFKPLAELKKWGLEDILMEAETVTLRIER